MITVVGFSASRLRQLALSSSRVGRSVTGSCVPTRWTEPVALSRASFTRASAALLDARGTHVQVMLPETRR
jgi:hypothetical protein